MSCSKLPQNISKNRYRDISPCEYRCLRLPSVTPETLIFTPCVWCVPQTMPRASSWKAQTTTSTQTTSTWGFFSLHLLIPYLHDETLVIIECLYLLGNVFRWKFQLPVLSIAISPAKGPYPTRALTSGRWPGSRAPPWWSCSPLRWREAGWVRSPGVTFSHRRCTSHVTLRVNYYIK